MPVRVTLFNQLLVAFLSANYITSRSTRKLRLILLGGFGSIG